MKKERGNFRPVYTSIWDDEDFKSFDSDTKVVFFNLRTSRFGNWPCIYVMYPENVAAQTGIPLKKVMGSLMTLSMRSWIAHIPPVVWITKGLRNDPNWNPGNSKQVSGIEEQLRSLPKNPLTARFCKFYGLSFPWISQDDPIDESIDDPIDDPIDEPTDVPTDGTGDVSRKPGDVSRKPEKEIVSAPADLPPLWNRICVSLPKCSKLTEKRITHIRARMKERPRLEDWEYLFRKIEGSPFLTGQNDRGWKADFEWIIKSPDNAVKVLEGKYDGGKNGSGNQGVHGPSSTVGNVKAKPGKYAGIGTSVCTDAPDGGRDSKKPLEDGGERGGAEKVPRRRP